MNSIQASKVDLALACGASTRPTDTKYNPNTEAGRLGTAVHECLELYIKFDDVRPEEVACKYDVKTEDVERLFGYGIRAWKEIKEPLGLVPPQTEISMSTDLVRCRADAIIVDITAQGPVGISLIDWKTGRVKEEKPGQMLAYASAARELYGMPNSNYIYTAEVWLREFEIIERRIDEARIIGFEERLREQLTRGTNSYSPGSHCTWCPHSQSCEARDNYLRASCQALSQNRIKEMTPASVAALWEQSRALKSALANYEKVVDQMIEQHGPLPISDGKVIAHIEKTKETIDAMAAWSEMSESLSQDEVNSVLSVSKTELLKLIGSKATRGQKQKAKAEFMERLKEAGAVVTSKHKQKKVINNT